MGCDELGLWWPRPAHLSSKHVTCLEALAVLVAVRLFGSYLRQASLPVALRSDSAAAVSCALNCYSRGDQALQRVVRELAYEAAARCVDLRVVEKVPREENTEADSLAKGVVPPSLSGGREVKVPPRNGDFWITRKPPTRLH